MQEREPREFDNIPGTFVFDGQRTRAGYHLNMFCKSLDEEANRARFKEEPDTYLNLFPMTDEQNQAVKDRDFLKMLNLGGNIYYLWKLASFDRITMHGAGAAQSGTGMTEQEFTQMMIDGGRPVQGNRYTDEPTLKADPIDVPRAKIVAGVGTSHVPAIGAALDNGKTEQPHWKALFDKFKPAREWIEEEKPDVCIIVYNDHAHSFNLKSTSTFSIGTCEEFQSSDEGYGPRPIPPVKGDPRLAWHIAESLVMDEFDMTIVNDMTVDHGLTVPLSIMYDQPEEWPCAVIPLTVNVVQYPQPTGLRCYKLGKALRKAIETYDRDLKVMVFGTGGLSHQLQGQRAGLINKEFDDKFLQDLKNNPEAVTQISHTEWLRETGSEGIEAIMWLIMRGALDDSVEDIYTFSHCPASNTNYGMTILKNKNN